MILRAASLPLVTLTCLLLAVPAMAGPVQLQPSTPSGTDIAGAIITLPYPGTDFLSTLHSSAPSGRELSGSLPGSPLPDNSVSPDKVIWIGGPPDPPVPIPVSEPSGILVMVGASLFGVLGIWRRNSNA